MSDSGEDSDVQIVWDKEQEKQMYKKRAHPDNRSECLDEQIDDIDDDPLAEEEDDIETHHKGKKSKKHHEDCGTIEAPEDDTKQNCSFAITVSGKEFLKQAQVPMPEEIDRATLLFATLLKSKIMKQFEKIKNIKNIYFAVETGKNDMVNPYLHAHLGFEFEKTKKKRWKQVAESILPKLYMKNAHMERIYDSWAYMVYCSKGEGKFKASKSFMQMSDEEEFKYFLKTKEETEDLFGNENAYYIQIGEGSQKLVCHKLQDKLINDGPGPRYGSRNLRNSGAGEIPDTNLLDNQGGRMRGPRKKTRNEIITRFILDELDDEKSKENPNFTKRGQLVLEQVVEKFETLDWEERVGKGVALYLRKHTRMMKEGEVEGTHLKDERIVSPMGCGLGYEIWKEWTKTNMNAACWIEINGESGSGKTLLMSKILKDIPTEKICKVFCKDTRFDGFGLHAGVTHLVLNEVADRNLVFHFKTLCTAADMVDVFQVRVAGTTTPETCVASNIISNNICPAAVCMQRWVDLDPSTRNKDSYQIARRVFRHIMIWRTCKCIDECDCKRTIKVVGPMVRDHETGKIKAPQEWIDKLPKSLMENFGLDPQTGRFKYASVVGANLTHQIYGPDNRHV